MTIKIRYNAIKRSDLENVKVLHKIIQNYVLLKLKKVLDFTIDENKNSLWPRNLTDTPRW